LALTKAFLVAESSPLSIKLAHSSSYSLDIGVSSLPPSGCIND